LENGEDTQIVGKSELDMIGLLITLIKVDTAGWGRIGQNNRTPGIDLIAG